MRERVIVTEVEMKVVELVVLWAIELNWVGEVGPIIQEIEEQEEEAGEARV